ncbi:mandelate racemase/muconate lactonizing enzyme family protein [Caballeronia sp. LP003]|uniref:mandelate racemase/muconate lactonizing enzyme family protein n=1 Tax=Caballeronia sp. LP003 TaxID=3038551 RepID=UPI00285894DB|nr:mandelate racemase/muconate lactonizing enzyme family protein [Caballeronia sp. LP003]MDR5785453.1 mandelate racemase/muconate lactonizing enzyme family protein [Caballeronia sp. LP003]
MPLGAARGGSGATRLQLALVSLTDKSGAVGSGYCYTLGPGMASVFSILEELYLPTVVGMGITAWSAERAKLRGLTHRMGANLTSLASSAVDIAIWDLQAVRQDLPLYRLMGAQRGTVPVYGSGRSTHAMTTQELIEGAVTYVDEGYKAVKLRIGMRTASEDLARVAAVRDVIGSGIGIMIDANERLDLPTALWLAPRLVDLDVLWFEEPLPSQNIDGYRVLQAGATPPIAIGEHLLGLREFVNFTNIASIWMPDIPLCGGITEFMKIDSLAEAHGAVVSPHFLPELHIHAAVAGSATTWLEHFPLLDELLIETLRIKDGEAKPTDRAGHGMRWDHEKILHLATKTHEVYA